MQMSRVVFSLAFLSWGVAFGQVSVVPAGVTLIWQAADKDAFEHHFVLNSQKPVAIAFYAESKGKKIVSFDRNKSKVSSLTDDQGTKIKAEVAYFAKIAKDGSAAFLEVNGETPVSSKASSLLVKASLQFDLASKTETSKSKVIAVKKGAKIELAEDLVFEIDEFGKPDFGEEPFSVELKIKRDIPDVAEVRFYDEAGNEIESESQGSSRMAFGKRVTVSRNYSLKKKVANLRMEVDRWADLERVTVPVDATIGIGGGK